MSRLSPTLEGFRATFRAPLLAFAEVAWRWTVGFTACALLLFSFFEYLNSLPVSKGDSALLSTRQPTLIGRAIGHILRGSLDSAVVAALLGVLALSLLWIMAASIGRDATVCALLDHFRSKFGNAQADDDYQIRPVRSLAALNFLRVTLFLAAILALAAAAILASFASSDSHPRPGLVFLLFMPLAGLIVMTGWALNWLLSLSGIFAVRDGDDALGAISSAVSFLRERAGPVLAVSIWTGLAHIVAFSVATTAVSVPLGLLRIAPWRVVIAVVLVVTLIYFAVADWLYMVRLAGYVCIREMPEPQLASVLPTLLPPDEPILFGTPLQTAIDRDEPILSDLPLLGSTNLAVET